MPLLLPRPQIHRCPPSTGPSLDVPSQIKRNLMEQQGGNIQECGTRPTIYVVLASADELYTYVRVRSEVLVLGP